MNTKEEKIWNDINGKVIPLNRQKVIDYKGLIIYYSINVIDW